MCICVCLLDENALNTEPDNCGNAHMNVGYRFKLCGSSVDSNVGVMFKLVRIQNTQVCICYCNFGCVLNRRN